MPPSTCKIATQNKVICETLGELDCQALEQIGGEVFCLFLFLPVFCFLFHLPCSLPFFWLSSLLLFVFCLFSFPPFTLACLLSFASHVPFPSLPAF